MRGITLRSLVAAIAAAAGLVMAAGSASAATPTHYTKAAAGFQASGNGWLYRYIRVQVTLPDITSNTWKSAIPGGYGVSIRLVSATETDDLGISTTPASGVYNAAFAEENSDGKTYGCINGNSPATSAGDTVVLTLFYNYPGFNSAGLVGQLNYAVSDLTHPSKGFSGHCFTPGLQSFTAAQVVAGFAANDYGSPSPAVTPVNGNHKLVQFNGTVITNRTGIRGSAGSAPWPVEKLAMTSDGTSMGTLLASTPFAWGTYAQAPDNVVRPGRNFSVWFPALP